jgi:hypothetical protein
MRTRVVLSLDNEKMFNIRNMLLIFSKELVFCCINMNVLNISAWKDECLSYMNTENTN